VGFKIKWRHVFKPILIIKKKSNSKTTTKLKAEFKCNKKIYQKTNLEIWLLLLLLFMFLQNLTPKKMLLRRDWVMVKEKKDNMVMDIAPITT
jgi:hypothetical protein